jgi:hypothetical protein
MQKVPFAVRGVDTKSTFLRVARLPKKREKVKKTFEINDLSIFCIL